MEAQGGRPALLLEEPGGSGPRPGQRVPLPREAEGAELGRPPLSTAQLLLGRDGRAATEDQRVSVLHAVQEDPLLLQRQGRRGKGREKDEVLR